MADGTQHGMHGRFVRPVGIHRFRYCYRVEEVHESEGFLAFKATRFGIDDELQPVADGHQNKAYPGRMTLLRPGVYRVHDNTGWPGFPLYYREIAVARQQMELFA